MQTRENRSPRWAGHLLAVVATAAAGLLRYALSGALNDAAPTIPFVLPVILAACYGGLWPGLLATGLGALAANYLFVLPHFSLGIESVAEGLALGLFIICGVAVSWLCEALHATRRRAEAEVRRARQEAEDRRRAEEALRGSEELTQQVIESSLDCIKVLDPEGRLISMSPGGQRLLEIPDLAAVLNQPWIDFWQGPHHEAARAAVAQAAAEGVGKFEGFCPTVTGKPKWWDVVVTPLRGRGGRTERLLAISRDITERKRSEELLARQKQVLELIVRGAALPEVLAVLCRAVEEQAEGAAIASILLLDPDGARLRHGAAPSLPDDYNQAIDGVGIGPDIGTCCAAASRREVVVTPDIAGDPGWSKFGHLPLGIGLRAAWSMPLLTSAGRALGTFGTYFREQRVPTAREREVVEVLSRTAVLAIERQRAEQSILASEERFRSLSACSPVGIFMTDTEGRCTYTNPCCQAICGFTPEQAQGEGWSRFVHADDRQKVFAHWSAVAQAGREYAGEFRFQHPDGLVRWTFVRSSPMLSDEGRLLGHVGTVEDITDRKEAESALRESEATLRTYYDSSPILMGVVQLDDDDIIHVYDNLATARYFGRGPGQTAGRRASELGVPPKAIREWSTHYRESQATGRPVQFEYEHQTETGSRWLVATVSCIGSVAPGEPRFCYVADDVTERKLAEEELRKFKFFSDHSSDLHFLLNEEAGFLYVNRVACERLGYTEEELLRLGVPDVDPNFPRGRVRALFDQSRRGRVPPFESALRRKDGTKLPVEVSITVLDRDRGPLMFAAVRDITERQRSEQERQRLLSLERAARADAESAQRRYRDLVDDLEAIVWEADAETWLFTFVSQRAEQMLGYPVERWLSEPGFWASIIHPEDREATVHHCRTACNDCRDHDFEYRAVGADGRVVWLRDIVYVVRGEDGRASRLRGVMVDVTRTKELEAGLQQRATELAEADRRKDEFLATLAHELRNPLAPIRNALQVLGMAGNNRAVLEQARCMMDRQLQQMVRLIDDLLDVSRITRNKLELRKEWVELAVAVQSAVETARPVIEAAEHRLTVQLPREPILLHADLTRLAQVFSNLLTNAAKYTERGGEIALTAERQGSDLVVWVRDSGIGIPADQLPTIFDLFVQVDRSLERSQGGLGIGLTLVKRLVELHGGSVDCRSDGPGQGSEFIVRLPLSIPSALRQGHLPTNGAALIPIRGRILVVDDNKDSAESLALLLQLRGAEVRTAHDGLEAVEASERFRPDVILLDIGMPKLNGYDAARRIREQAWAADTLLIAMTGWGQDEDKRRAVAAGFDHHLVKPVDPDELEKLLTAVGSADRG